MLDEKYSEKEEEGCGLPLGYSMKRGGKERTGFSPHLKEGKLTLTLKTGKKGGGQPYYTLQGAPGLRTLQKEKGEKKEEMMSDL